MSQFPKLYNKIFDYSLRKTTHVNFYNMIQSISMKKKI